MITTPNFGLKKPEANDTVNIADLNYNADIIDEKLKEIEDKVENIEVPVTSVNGKTGNVELTAEDVGAETPTGAQEKANQAEANAKAYTDQEVSIVANDLTSHKNENVQQFEEIYNRLSKLKGNDIQARREILDTKLKLDEMEVVDYLNKTGIGFYDLFENIEYIDISNTTATVDTASADVIFTGQESLKMLPQKFDENFNNIELAIYDIERENFEVDNSVSNSNQIQITVQSGKINIGEKYYYNGEVYEVTGVSEA